MRKIRYFVLGALAFLTPEAARAAYMFTTIAVPGGLDTAVDGINDLGQVIGTYLDPVQLVTDAFIENGGVFASISFPGAISTNPYGINDAGQVVGTYTDSANTLHGFVYSGGVFGTISVPGATSTVPLGINNVGQVVGYYRTGGINVYSFVEAGGVFTTTINAPGAYYGTQLWDINDNGQISGSSLDSHFLPDSFVYDSGVFSPVNVPGATNTRVADINNAGQVVGQYADTQELTHGFVDNGGVFTTVDVVLSGNTYAYGINNAGQVAGTYFDNLTGHDYGFVATPTNVPEPNSITMFGLACLGLGFAQRRFSANRTAQPSQTSPSSISS